MLGFLDSDPDGGFVGEITDPIPLGRLGDAEFGSTTSLPEVVGEVHRGGP
jgi:hypothetical protein